MKKVLGLDLGSASVGWALISEDEKEKQIIGMGSRIIPYDGTEGKDFAKGTGESRNSLRTKTRTARKGYDRYQLRRKYLVNELIKNNMMPDKEIISLSKMNLWELRDKATHSIVSLREIGRLYLWLNQKRGYKSSRSDANIDKKDTQYVADVKNRHENIKSKGQTIGQYFYNELKKNEYYRVKENIFPREAYIEEFDKITEIQKKYHPELNEELISRIRNEIIFYQRPLKSQKGLVSVCEFEGFIAVKDEKEYFVGPKVAPKSSPIFQITKIWENINSIKITNKSNEEIIIPNSKKNELFNHLNTNEKLTSTDLLKILNLSKNDCFLNKQIEKGIQGNITYNEIKKKLKKEYSHLLEINCEIIDLNKECYLYDLKTGELLNSKNEKIISKNIIQEPLYKIWHTIYSINDEELCSKTLQNNFSLDEETAKMLANIDFSKYGYGNKSVKAMRKILPYLIDGDNYSDSMCYAGYNHSFSLTKEQNIERKLLDKLKPIEKNSLRQPIVEKILNQMINVVNAVIDEYGKPDEIRVELARELKQSKEERSDADKYNNKRQRENEEIAKSLTEYGLRSTRNNIIKWRLYQEIDNTEKKLNAICIYCGQPISLTEAIKGNEIDIEHIIPKSKLFDDSQSNKTLAHKKCNKDKNDRTAFDFMKSKPDNIFNEYIDRVNNLYANKIINKAKRDKLLMSEDKIPSNFIDRQLRESQYIAKKSIEILKTICHNVWSTSGNVTAELRHIWGWDDVTMNLQMPKYKELGLTETVEWESQHGKNKHIKEIIKDWTKRDDHRHHAIDALTIACTKQGYIQKFNTLNAEHTRNEMFDETKDNKYNEKHSLLEKYLISQKPFSVKEVENATANILVSFKAGKKVAVKGTRKIGKRGNKKVVQKEIIIPRGALSEESVYGRIKWIEEKKPLKYLFENPHLIYKQYIKEIIESILQKNDENVKKSLDYLKRNPVYLKNDTEKLLEYATCYTEEYVIKYNVDINFNKTDKVVDKRIREILQNRLNKFGGKSKEAFKDILTEDKKTIKWYDDEKLEKPIKSVRCFTGLSAVVPVKKDENSDDIGFVKPGNNHHIAIYSDTEGKKIEHVCTFWHAVERKKYNFPVIIKNTNEIWDKILQLPENALPESFLEKLPPANLNLDLSMQQNEMFILGIPENEVIEHIEKKNYDKISNNLYRVQKIAETNYMFRHHLETQIIDDDNSKQSKRFLNIRSIGSLFTIFPYKISISVIGKIKNTVNAKS